MGVTPFTIEVNMYSKLICAISIICLAVVLVLVLVLKDIFQVLVLVLGGQVQEVLVLVLVLGGQVLVLGSQVLVLVLGVRSLLTSLEGGSETLEDESG